MKTKKHISALLLLFILTSCAFHSGQLGHTQFISEKSQLSSFVYGTATTTRVFGIGGLGKDALVLDAKRNLLNNVELNKDETLTNFTLDFKTTYFIIGSKTKVIVSAEIHTSAKDNKTSKVDFKDQLSNLKSKSYRFTIGEEAWLQKNNKYIPCNIIQFVDNNIIVQYISKKGFFKTKKVYDADLYKISKSNNNKKMFGAEIGEEVKTLVGNQVFEARVVALGKTKNLVEYTNKKGEKKLNSYLHPSSLNSNVTEGYDF